MSTHSSSSGSEPGGFMDLYSRIYIAGHRGLVGSAILRDILRRGYRNILTRTHEELDLCD